MRLIIFITLYIAVFGVVQWNLLKHFSIWISEIYLERQKSFRNIFLGILIMGNVTVLMRLIFSRVGGYETVFAQWVIYIAGVFTAVNLMALLILIFQKLFEFAAFLFKNVRQ